MSVRHLERVVPAPGPRDGGAGPDHPMRIATRAIALEPGGWNPARIAEVTALFDSLAPEWHTRGSEPRLEVVADALDRGGPIRPGTWLELGSGTGLLTPWLAARCALVVAAELAPAMLAFAPAGIGSKVRADGAALPLAGARVDALVLVNAFLFPAEAGRILAPDGAVVWVNTAGPRTPIHLPAPDVLAALDAGAGGAWDGVSSEAASGTWVVARRAGRPGGGASDGAARAGRGRPAGPAA